MELMVRDLKLEFLHKAGFQNKQRLEGYMSDLYERADEAINHLDDDVPFLGLHIPTRFAFVQCAWDFHEFNYWDYCWNGHDEAMLEQIKEELEEGREIDDILEGWREFKEYNSGFVNAFNPGDTEGQLIRDVVKLLDTFNITYLLDDCETVYHQPLNRRIGIKDWINPPIRRVW